MKKWGRFSKLPKFESAPPIFFVSEKFKNIYIQAILGHDFTIHAIAYLSRKMIKSSEIASTAVSYFEL